MNLDPLFRRYVCDKTFQYFAAFRDGNYVPKRAIATMRVKGLIVRLPDGREIPDPAILAEFNKRWPQP